MSRFHSCLSFLPIVSFVWACSSSDAAPAGTPNGDGSAGASGAETGGSDGGGGASTGGRTNGGSSGTGGSKATGGAGGAAGQPDAGPAPPDAAPIPTCNDFCQLEEDNCGFTGANHQFASNDACMQSCALYAKNGPDGAVIGNSLQCRMTHLGYITAGAAATLHCPHTGETPTGACVGPSVDPCVTFCALDGEKCGFTGPNHQFTSQSACETSCALYAKNGQDGATSGNTLQCRMTHLGLIKAPADATTQCPYTGETPSAMCVNN